MPTANNPRRDVVKPLVVNAIHDTMRNFGDPDRDYTVADLMAHGELTIEGNLGIPENIHALLKNDYSDISRSFGGKSVSADEASDAETVDASVDLVYLKANTKKGAAKKTLLAAKKATVKKAAKAAVKKPKKGGAP